MKKVGQKVLAVLLCVCLVFSCMTISASAFVLEAGAVFSALSSILTVYSAVSTLAGLYYKEPNIIMDSIRDDIYGKTSNFLWCVPSAYLNSASTRIEIPYTSLSMISQDWNLNYSGAGFDFPCQLVKVNGADGKVYTVIKLMQMQDRQDTTGRTKQAWFLGDGSGRILCSTEPINAAGTWIAVNKLKSPYNMVSLEALYDMAKGEGGTVRKSGEMYFVMNTLKTQVLAASDGHAYAAWANEEQSAVDQDRPMAEGSVTNNITNNNTTENITNNYISNTQIDEGDTFYTYNTTNNSYNTTNETYETIINNIKEGDTYYVKEGDTYYEIVVDNSMDFDIDIENMTMVGEGGVINNIDSLIYDATSKTYFLSTFFKSGDTYEYNYYTYEYHINYTSVTYIGYTEQYDKYYELYYQLPDGRSSADLTAADLEQLSTSFKDVVNYARSADDLSQRALYHFDGNTEDSSYWSYCSAFDWAKGASLTYMDEGTFGGSLYLDETEHDFAIMLPSNSDVSNDFTLQFRYYQSHTESPTLDSYITIGGLKVMQFDGVKYYNGSGAAITPTSVGSWNELCFMRKDGVLYYYINGVPYGNMSVSIGSGEVRFYFGATQQTYKKLDELRFTRGAIYESGKGYTPTSVPYDSNLSLVLPDGKIPLADEIVVLNPGTNNSFVQKNLDDWSDSSVISSLGSVATEKFYYGHPTYTDNKMHSVGLFYNSAFTTLAGVGDSVSMSCKGTAASTKSTSGSNVSFTFQNGLFLPINAWRDTYEDGWVRWTGGGWENYKTGVPWTLSVVLSDGSFSWITFQLKSYSSSALSNARTVSVVAKDVSSVLSLNHVTMSFSDSSSACERVYFNAIQIVPASGTTAQIVHMELTQGSAPGWSVSYEGAIYDPGELADSPVLAVRSNTPISTYQIGGVRPSYPKKGQVYAMVENGYITSLQQYTGSAWEAVDGRIWTGSRWIPASSYNVITLQDMYDIVDATPDYEYIYTESGFWDWFQRAWKDLLARLDKIIDGQKGSGGGTALDPEDDTMLPSVEDNPETETDEGWGAFDLLIVIKDGTWSIITGIVKTGFDGLVGLANGFTYVTGFFNAYDANSPDNVLGFTNYGGADIWD